MAECLLKEHNPNTFFRIKTFGFFSNSSSDFIHLEYPDNIFIHKKGKLESIINPLNPEALSPVTYYNDLVSNKKKGLVAYMGSRGRIYLRDMALDKTKKIDGWYPFAFDMPGSLFAYEYDGNIEVRAIDQRYKILHRFPSMDHLDVLSFSPDSRLLAASGLDGYIKLYDLQQNRELVTLIGINDEGFISIVDNKYYYSSTEDIQQSVFYIHNDRIYPFEQFDLKYNRPDIVIERMGMASSELVKVYKKAYEKRLRTMSFTEDMLSDDFHVPDIDVTWPTYTHTRDSLVSFFIRTRDSLVLLDRLHVYVNGVPVFGSNGKSLKSLETHEYEEKVQVSLGSGQNLIQVVVYNQSGAVSTRETYKVDYSPVLILKPDLFIVAIGVDQFYNQEYNLKYPIKDLEDIISVFKQKSDAYGNIHIIRLYNGTVNLENINKTKDILRRTSINDKVVVVVSGHGLIDDQLNYYFATPATAFDNASQTAVPFEALENILDSIPARSKVLFMDACHAGEVDRENMDLVKSENTIKGKVQFRNISNNVTFRRIDETAAFELMKSVFVDLRKGTGATVIASASAYEFAFEGDKWSNSVFTYALLEGLQNIVADKDFDGQVMISELHEYLQDSVFKLTGGLQKPTPRIENPINDWKIW